MHTCRKKLVPTRAQRPSSITGGTSHSTQLAKCLQCISEGVSFILSSNTYREWHITMTTAKTVLAYLTNYLNLFVLSPSCTIPLIQYYFLSVLSVSTCVAAKKKASIDQPL